jgi:hypothetical protein
MRVAAEALRRAGNSTESTLDGLRVVPNRNLIPFEKNESVQVIDEMVQECLNFQSSALKYKEVNLKVEVEPVESGVFGAIKIFSRNSWSLIKVLPLWFFAAIWNFIARAVTLKLFGARGREVAKGTIDFPKTDLDKDAARNLFEIKDRRQKVKEVLGQWPRNTLRKSEPGLWTDLRRIVLGMMDGSALPNGKVHVRDVSGIRVLGELNQVLPSLHEKWKLPDDIVRTLETEPRSATWQEMEILTGIENFLQIKVTASQVESDRLAERIAQLDLDLTKMDMQLKEDSQKLEHIRISSAYSSSEGGNR